MNWLQRRSLVRRDRIEVAAVWVPLAVTVIPWVYIFSFFRLIDRGYVNVSHNQALIIWMAFTFILTALVGFLYEPKVMSNWLRYWMLFVLFTGIVVITGVLWLVVLAPALLIAPTNPLLLILALVVSLVVVIALRRSRFRLLATWVMLPGPLLYLCLFNTHAWFFWLLMVPVVLSPIAALYSARRIYSSLRAAPDPAAAIEGPR